MAKTMEDDGENEYLVTDDNGCATDSAVFGEWISDVNNPGLLIPHFDAFQFPSSKSIRFHQCNVRVCFGKCQPVNCNGVDVKGRRKRQMGYTAIESLLGPFRIQFSNAISTPESIKQCADPNDGNCTLQPSKSYQRSSRIL
jgi:hypothetical protein